MTDNNVFLKASQTVYSTGNRGISKYLCGLLERSSREEGIDFERCPCDAQEHWSRNSRLATFLHDTVVFLMELVLIDLLSVDKACVARTHNFDLFHHLANDNANVFVVDGYALQPIHLLNLIHKEVLASLLAKDIEDIMRVFVAIAQKFARLNLVIVPHKESSANRHEVLVLFAKTVRNHDDPLVLYVATNRDFAGHHGKYSRVLGFACFKKFADPR